VVLQRVPEAKTAKARIHFDPRVADIETEVRRLEALGARRIDIGPGPDPGWIPWRIPKATSLASVPAFRYRTGRHANAHDLSPHGSA
jgi:hypothetical protein